MAGQSGYICPHFFVTLRRRGALQVIENHQTGWCMVALPRLQHLRTDFSELQAHATFDGFEKRKGRLQFLSRGFQFSDRLDVRHSALDIARYQAGPATDGLED